MTKKYKHMDIFTGKLLIWNIPSLPFFLFYIDLFSVDTHKQYIVSTNNCVLTYTNRSQKCKQTLRSTSGTAIQIKCCCWLFSYLGTKIFPTILLILKVKFKVYLACCNNGLGSGSIFFKTVSGSSIFQIVIAEILCVQEVVIHFI